jgi:hypothetical protein
MKTVLTQILRNHLLLVIYMAVFGLLLIGIVAYSGFKYVNYLSLYFGSFLAFYFLLFKISRNLKFRISTARILEKIRAVVPINYVIGFSMFAVALHLIYLKGIPAIDGLYAFRLSEVVAIRRAITEDVPSWINYVSSWNIRAIIPIVLTILFLRKDKRMYWLYFFIAVFYSFALMQKSMILFVLIPVGFLSLYQRKWMYSLKLALTSLVVIIGLSYIQNVSLRGGLNDVKLEHAKDPNFNTSFEKILYGLKKRIILVPGKTVVAWFEHIPSDKPFLNGNGYRLVSKISGGTYHNYARELYPYVYEENAKHGLVGSVNVASFMRGYSNFGAIGLVLSAFFLALTLIGVGKIFTNNFVFNLAFNSFPVVFLSSTSLLTTCLSGGWILTIGLFLLYRDQFVFDKSNVV